MVLAEAIVVAMIGRAVYRRVTVDVEEPPLEDGHESGDVHRRDKEGLS